MSDDDMAVDAQGQPLPMGPDAVQAMVRKIIHDGEILAVIVRGKNGELAVPTFGPPSRELLEALETAARSYGRALKGHA